MDKEALEAIALNYHLAENIPDMFIENICQDFELEWIKSRIGNDSKVLDLGLGDNRFLRAFLNHEHVTILEASAHLCKAASEIIVDNNSKTQVIETFFENFDADAEYDVVIASHVLEHVEEPNLLFTKILSWLKPEGIALVIVPNRESLHRQLGVEMGIHNELDWLSPRDNAVGHKRVYSLKSLTHQAVQAGFKVVEHRGFFIKSLANSQMLHLNPRVILGLCEISTNLPTELGANIGLVLNRA